MDVILDRLIIKYEKVTAEQFEKFLTKLTARQILMKNTPIHEQFGLSVKDYYRNIHIGQGEGKVFIGWHHNSADKHKGYWDMKVELNPSKFTDKELHEDDREKVYENIFTTLNTVLESNRRMVMGMDIAFDIERDKEDLIPYSKTGRHQDRHKGTIYYGNRNLDGYLKIYDKKKELKQKFKREIEAEFLTRIEYSFRDKKGVTLDGLSKSAPFEISEFYNVVVLDLNSVKGSLKASLICYSRGLMDLKEFPRRTKESMKIALNEMEQLTLDSILQSHWESVSTDIKKYIRL